MTTTTQKSRILAWLKRGRKITPLDALVRFHCMRLGARIYELRRDGHPIESELVRVRRGGPTVARYWMAR